MEKEKIPQIILDVGFDFDWNEKDVWSLDYPKEEINISLLEWHFDIPFWNYGNNTYNLNPIDVIADKSTYEEEYDRIMKSDLSYPIDIM